MAVGDGRNLVATATTESAHAVWRRWLRSAQATVYRISGRGLPDRVSVAPAQSQLLPKIFGHESAAVGDAAYAFDPLAASGISKALIDAVELAGALVAALSGDDEPLNCYEWAVREDYASYLDDLEFYYGLVWRWPDAPFWRRRRRSSDPRFKCYVTDNPCERSTLLVS